MLPNRSGDIEMYEEMVWNRGGRALVEYTPLPSVARFGEKLPFWLNFKSLWNILKMVQACRPKISRYQNKLESFGS